MFILNKQVELLELYRLEKYDEKLFTVLFDVTNKINIRKIRIGLYSLLSPKDRINICAKVYKKIRNLKTQNIISNEVSCLLNLYN